MAYPQKLLASNETVELEMRPHWRALILPVLWLLIIVAVSSYLFAKLEDMLGGTTAALPMLRWAIIAIAVFLAVFLFVRPLIAWLTTQYVFTNRRIIVRTGFITRKGRDMPLSKVNDVTFEHSVLERMFNCGRLVVESASENGSLHIEGVPNVEFVQREVFRLHDEDDAFRAARSEMYGQQFRAGTMLEPLVGQFPESAPEELAAPPPDAQSMTPPAFGGNPEDPTMISPAPPPDRPAAPE